MQYVVFLEIFVKEKLEKVTFEINPTHANRLAKFEGVYYWGHTSVCMLQ